MFSHDRMVFSERELTFATYCPRPSVVCLSSVTFVRPTQPAEIFGNFCASFGTFNWPSVDIHVKFYVDRPSGTPGRES